MNKDYIVFLLHIRDSINYIEDFVKDISEDEFLKDVKVQDAVVRRIEIIVEAVKNLPEDIRKKYQDTPWKDIAGMRYKITHHYFGIDLNKVWNVVEKDIPVLKKQIKEILEKEKK